MTTNNSLIARYFSFFDFHNYGYAPACPAGRKKKEHRPDNQAVIPAYQPIS